MTIDNSLPSDDASQPQSLEEALRDPRLVKLAITPEFGMSLVGLLQLALRHPQVNSEFPNMAAEMRPFVESLADKVARTFGDKSEPIRALLARGWDENNDVTAEEFDRDFDLFFSNLDEEN